MYTKNKLYLNKILTILLLLTLFSSSFFVQPAFAYFDKLQKQGQILLTTGEWATPITTRQEFYNYAVRTNAVATDNYIIMNNLDFSGFTWTYNTTINSNAVFRGKLYGNYKTISNLTINYNSTSYTRYGIFPRMQGGAIYNLNFDNVFLTLGSSSLSGTTGIAGLITANVYGSNNTLQNLTITNSGVRATSSSGSGGLVGLVDGASTILNIENVKTTNLKVFNKSSNAGGLVGRINSSGAQLNVKDVDLDGEVHSYASSSYTGGVVGNIISGGKVSVERAILNITSRNTLETNSTYYNRYSQRYLGGVVGYTASASANVTITDVFFTGSLYTQANNRANNIGTVTGYFTSTSNRPLITRVFHSNVEFRSATNGSVIYTPTSPTGQMATVVVANSMPSSTWWNSFFANYNVSNNYWSQNVSTGQPYLVR